MAEKPSVSIRLIFSESKRIVNAHSRHFLALSVLFIFPICFLGTVYPAVFSPLSQPSAAHYSASLLRSGSDEQPRAFSLLRIAYFVVSIICGNLAIGSITYSVVQGFYGRPMKLSSAVKSGLTSFFPLLGTTVSIVAITWGIGMMLALSAFMLGFGFGLTTGVEIDFSSSYFLAFGIFFVMVWSAIVMYLSVNWILARAIVVVESVWGFTALKRSKSLTEGRKGVSLALILLFSFFSLFISMIILSAGKLSVDGVIDGSWWIGVGLFVLHILVVSGFWTLLSLYSMVTSAVMYMYCKTAQSKVSDEIDENLFAGEYERLPFEEGKAPRVVDTV